MEGPLRGSSVVVFSLWLQTMLFSSEGLEKSRKLILFAGSGPVFGVARAAAKAIDFAFTL